MKAKRASRKRSVRKPSRAIEMKIEVIHYHHHHEHADGRVLYLLERIMGTQTEHAADLQVITDQVTKIGTETSASLAKITELEAAIAVGGQTSPEVNEKVAALKAQLQVVDELVADVSASPPEDPMAPVGSSARRRR